MDTKKLMFIKRLQREYFSEFEEKLEIDWEAMNGTGRSLPTLKTFDEAQAISKLEDLCLKYDTSVSVIKNNRIQRSTYPKETMVLIDWCRWIKENKFFEGKACKLINKDRSVIYYYGDKKGKYKARGKKSKES